MVNLANNPTNSLSNPSQDLLSIFGDLITTSDLETLVVKPEESNSMVLLGEQLTTTAFVVPEYKFRTIKSAKNPLLQISAPGGKDGNGAVREIQMDLFAVRGIPIKFAHTFQLYDGDNTICRTVAMEPDGQAAVHDPLGPLSNPWYGPEEYGKDKQVSRQVISANPIGSRGFSCRSCVMNGLNTVQKGEGTATCGGGGNVVMAVTHVCISKANMVTKKNEAQWVPVNALKTMDGQQIFDAPFIIVNIQIGKSSYYLGKKGIKVEPAGLTPADVTGWSEMLSFCYENKLVTSMVDGVDVNQRIIPALVEMWAAEPLDKTVLKNTACLPTFKLLSDHIGTAAMEKIVSMSYQAYKQEYTQYGGKLDSQTGLPTVGKYTELTAESENAALKEALAKNGAPVNGSSVSANPFASAAASDTNTVIDVTPASAEVIVEEAGAMPSVFSRK